MLDILMDVVKLSFFPPCYHCKGRKQNQRQRRDLKSQEAAAEQ